MENASLNPIRILFFDDEPEIREAITKWLEVHFSVVLTFCEAGLKSVSFDKEVEKDFDLIICTSDFENKNESESVLDFFYKLKTEVPFILYSANVTKSFKEVEAQHSNFKFVSKLSPIQKNFFETMNSLKKRPNGLLGWD